ncbi:MAG: TIGR02281 family clan AA aspartic protease [Magnetococcales bacterium]|nr:TIGR02281 family clan AA aspartic protease [Magnetococcales bacterium]
MRLYRFITVFAITSVLALFLNNRFFGDLSTGEGWDRMGYAAGSIVIISWLLSTPLSGSTWKSLQRIGGWSLFLLLIITLYSFRSDLGAVKNRVMAAIIPQSGFVMKPGSMSFYRSRNGHFHVEALVNGVSVRFLVDTGASDVVIAPHLAPSLGYHLRASDYTKVYHTANGKGRGAPVTLQTFQVGELTLENLPASVNGAPMRTSLLGMRFFNRLRSFQVEDELLTLHW